MELVPRALVIGVFIPPPGVPGAPAVGMDKINRIWSEVAPQYGYTQLQSAPDGAAAQFLGASADIGVTIQPPLIQVRDIISNLDPADYADKAEQVIKAIARVLGTNQFFNLGVKHIYHAPLETNDARAFVHNKILRGQESLANLELGGNIWSGVKHVVNHADGVYELAIEPLQSDDMKSLFLDLDAQFPGPLANLGAITERARDAKDYLANHVVRYLESL